MKILQSIINIYFAFFLILSAALSAQTIKWETAAEMPLARRSFYSTIVEDKLYAIGGYCAETEERYESLNFQYDPVKNNWEVKSPAPTGRSNLAVNSVNEKIYVIGGDPVSDATEVYAPKTDTWTKLTPMPTPRQHIHGAVINEKIYIVGGLESDPSTIADTTKKWFEKILVSDKNEAYNVATDTWEVLSPMPTKRHGAAVAVVNNKLYVFCGAGSDTTLWERRNNVEVYDPTTDKWKELSPMPLAKLDPGIAVIGNEIFFFGGQDGSKEPRGDLKSVFVYNTINDEWRRINDLPYDLMFSGVSVLNDKIFIIGGSDSDFKEYKKVIVGTLSWDQD